MQDIEGYEGLYTINTECEVLNKKTGRELKGQFDGRGFRYITLSKDGKAKTFSMHQLLAINFIANGNELPYVRHKNGDPMDNSIGNLEWTLTPEPRRKRYY